MATNANEILDRLAALLDAATPGPMTCEGMGGIRTDGTRDSYFVMSGSTRVCGGYSAVGTNRAQKRNDMQAIAAMLTAAPALIRLARATVEFEKHEIRTEVKCYAELLNAIKALGEVRL